MDSNVRANRGEHPGNDALIVGGIRVFAIKFLVKRKFPKVGRGWGENANSKKKGLSYFRLTP
jgi:hypothetical protein